MARSRVKRQPPSDRHLSRQLSSPWTIECDWASDLVHWAEAPAGSQTNVAAGGSTLINTWVQTYSRRFVSDTYRQTYQFNVDGTYEFALSVGSGVSYSTWVRQTGTFVMTGDRLSLTSDAGQTKSFRIELGKDPFGSRLRLVLFGTDGRYEHLLSTVGPILSCLKCQGPPCHGLRRGQ